MLVRPTTVLLSSNSVVTKHMAGKHDQKTHRSGRGVLTDTPAFDEEQQLALESYMTDTFWDINSHLRGNPLEQMDDFEFDYNMSLLDSAMEKSKLAHDTELVRIVDIEDIPASAQVGTVFEDKGFISTSKTGTVPDQIYDWVDMPIMLKIKAPAGTKAIDLDLTNPSATKLGEVLLNRGTKFRITNLDNFNPDAIEPSIELEIVNE